MDDDFSFPYYLDELTLKLPRKHVKTGFFDIMENYLSTIFEKKVSSSSVDWKGNLYNDDKITDFPLTFISNTTYLLNHEMLRTLTGRKQLW